jgi:hypothetical protein
MRSSRTRLASGSWDSLPGDFALALTHFLTDAIDVVETLGVALTLVHDAVNDFSGIDLRDVDLAGVPLRGVRWSPKPNGHQIDWLRSGTTQY